MKASEHTTLIVGSTTAFQLFALTALVSFCFSITCLAAFLAIYSSRNEQYRHYRRALPLKLLVVSIISILISFCVAHVFELYPKHKSRCLYLCTFFSLPYLSDMGSSRHYSCTYSYNTSPGHSTWDNNKKKQIKK
ncbi:hypothetical protein K1719_023379 [Acacia pycnantha]|nr:hypothetical protein K1719_023379 [Acacia pycnantha]